MPSIEIDYSEVAHQLSNDANNEPNVVKGIAHDGSISAMIPTADGFALLEIQGLLNLPTKITSDHELIDLNDLERAVKVGKLEIDGNKATLYIGTSQRLLGIVEKIDPPFGLLQFPTQNPATDVSVMLDEEDKDGSDSANAIGLSKGNDDDNEEKIKMISIVDRKVVFKHRPLPIM